MKVLPTKAIALMAVLAASLQVLAEAPPVSRTELQTAIVHGAPTVERILSYRIGMDPKIAGQKHYHPMPVVGYVVSGEIAFQIEGKKLTILRSGDAFLEPANATIIRWENIGSTRAIFVANYIAASEHDELLVRIE